MCHSSQVEVRGQISGVRSLFLPRVPAIRLGGEVLFSTGPAFWLLLPTFLDKTLTKSFLPLALQSLNQPFTLLGNGHSDHIPKSYTLKWFLTIST